MKQILLWAGLLTLAACTSSTESKQEAATTTAASNEKITYAMPSQYSDTWEIGDPKNAATLLNMYKGWVDGNFDSFKSALADSVELYWATGDINKGPRDSILPIIIEYRNQFSEIKNEIHVFLSVRHKDSKEDWVMVRLKEITTAKNGKKDSVELQENWRFNSAGKTDKVYQYNAALKPQK